MATASLQLPDGTTVTIDGSPDEVAALVERISRAGFAETQVIPPRTSRPRRVGSQPAKVKAASTKVKPKGPTDYIRELVDDDFFSTKRGIGDVKATLEERAHFYPATSLSPALVRLVRKRELRRIKEDGQWKYVAHDLQA